MPASRQSHAMMKHGDESVKAAGILLMCSTETNRAFLLMRHHDRWDLPKGHCEPGETFRQAALRETEEETGIAPSKITLDEDFVFQLVYPVTYQEHGGGTFVKQVQYFLGYVKDKPTLQLSEHESAQWFDWNPPHRIQQQTVDPLLAAVADHLKEKRS